MPLALLAALALVISGCAPADDESTLIHRTSDALVEVGASQSLMKCLTENLGDHLTEADAKIAYEDHASEPEVSDISLNRVSLLEKNVRARLLHRARVCRSVLVSRGRYTPSEIDRMLHRIGNRGYRNPDLFLER